VASAEDGFWQSSGVLNWQLGNAPASSRFTAASGYDANESVSGKIRYTVYHAPGSSGLSRYEADVEVDGKLAEMVTEFTGSIVVLRTSGHAGFDGNWSHQFNTPAVSFDSDSVNVRIPQSNGTVVTTGNQQANFDWSLKSAAATTETGRFFAKGLRISGIVEDMVMGTGKSVAEVESVVGGGMTLAALKMISETTESNGKLDSVMTSTVDKITGPGPEVTGLRLGMEMRGFDAEALRSLQEAMNDMHGQMEALDKAQALAFESALARLMDAGASMAMTDLSGTADGQPFSGSWNLALQPGDASTPMAQRLTAAGKLSVSGGLVPPHFADMAKGTGYVTTAGDQLAAGFQLSNGELQINGQPVPIVNMQLQPMLQMLDTQLQGWRDGLSRGQPSLMPMRPVVLRR
jgi:hypothetical protein